VTFHPKRIATLGVLVAVAFGARPSLAEEEEANGATTATPEHTEAPQEGELIACVRAAEDAQSLRSAHRLRAAFKHLLVCSQSNCPSVVRKDCSYWLTEVEKLVPSVTVQAVDKDGRDLTDVSVSMDGEPLVSRLDGLAVPVDPGVRTFRFEHVGSTPIEQKIVIREGQKGRPIRIMFDPRPPPPPPRPVPAERRYRVPAASVVFGAVGTLALGSFAYFGITGRADAAELADGCGKNKTCSEGEVSKIRTKLLVADVSLGVGLVSLGAATYLFFAGNEKPAPAVTADVAVGRDGGRVAVRARF
jgi:hypothetical protein